MLETDKRRNGLGGVVFGYDTNIISLWVPSPLFFILFLLTFR
jgi:hypothetical protein